MISVLVALLALLAQADVPKPLPWKADYKLTIEKSGEDHVFVIEGTTNLPVDTVLRARVYAVEVVDGFNGKREDEEPLVWEDDEGQRSYKILELKEGKFREEVYRFRRKPYPLLYRARVHYIPRQQSSAEVLKKVGDDDFSLAADLALGTPKDLAQEVSGRVKEVSEDLAALDGLYRDIKRRFGDHRKKFDLGDWNGWKAGWLDRVIRLQDANKERYNLWAVWMERQTKMRVDGMCVLLTRMLSGCTEIFTQPAPEEDPQKEKALQRLQELIEGFHVYYEEAVDVIGVPIPLDAERIAPILAAYEKAFGPLRTWIGKPEGDAAELRAEVRRGGLEALLQLPPLLQNRKTAYTFVNDLSLRFRRLLELVEAKSDAGALKKVLAEHDEALRDFKKLADLAN